MSGYVFDFTPLMADWPLIVSGLENTLSITAVAALAGLLLGFLICLARLSRNRLLSGMASFYVEIFRCTPALVQLIWIFYCLPIFLGIFLPPIPTAILALSLNVAAFNAEAFRAAIQALPRAHIDASSAIGLSGLQAAVLVILPQALLSSAPVLIANVIGLLQQSALVSIVAIDDLMYQGKFIATTSYRPIETMSVIALIYLSISVVISRLASAVSRRYAP